MNTFTPAQLDEFLRVLRQALVMLRATDSLLASNLYWGKSRGIAVAGRACGLITLDEFYLIEGLIDNASHHAAQEARHAA